MKILTERKFEKDVLKLDSRKLKQTVLKTILNIKNCKKISEIPNLVKIQGSTHFYRIRVNNFRMGVKFQKPDTVILVRFLSRKDIYKKFP